MPRKAMTKEAKIKRALDNGIAVNEIARRYRTSQQYVNLIRRKHCRQHEHIVGPLPLVPDQSVAPSPPAQPAKEEPMFAAGIVALHPVPDTPQPTAGILAVPPARGEVVELMGPPAPTLTRWQRFKLWAWGRA